MKFELKTLENGEFAIVQTKPIVVGTFSEKETALKVMTFLTEEAMDAMAESCQKSPAKSQEPKPRPKPKPRPEPKPESVWTEAELQQAFDRAKRGERLTKIAEEFGKSFTSLRARWAANKRKIQAVNTPPNVLSDPAQVNCSLCDRQFTPSLSNSDTCARCTRV